MPARQFTRTIKIAIQIANWLLGLKPRTVEYSKQQFYYVAEGSESRILIQLYSVRDTKPPNQD